MLGLPLRALVKKKKVKLEKKKVRIAGSRLLLLFIVSASLFLGNLREES